jgi:hypothetical protein
MVCGCGLFHGEEINKIRNHVNAVQFVLCSRSQSDHFKFCYRKRFLKKFRVTKTFSATQFKISSDWRLKHIANKQIYFLPNCWLAVDPGWMSFIFSVNTCGRDA